MCGIFGLVSQTVNPATLVRRMRSAKDLLIHRGPDDFGIKDWGHPSHGSTVSLGQTRLAIIDLTSGGHQPLSIADGNLTVVFNGEIYNYRELKVELQAIGYKFSSESDTEVLLKAWQEWGQSCLQKIEGMFAFVIFDHLRQQLICVRDAFGIKPFFYHMSDGTFAFASEPAALNALLDVKPSINQEVVVDYLLHGVYDRTENSFFEGINQLHPAGLLTVNLGEKGITSDKQTWWRPDFTEPDSVSFEAAAEEVRELFLSNVKLQLRSDVPLGAALSGGLDSSSVVCAARYLEPSLELNTFSYVARGHAMDEERWVDEVNSYVGAKPHKVTLEPIGLTRDLAALVRSQGEPFGSTSIYAQYKVFEAVASNGVTVTLDGQGADELLAGYHGYPEARVRSLMEVSEFRMALSFISEWGKWPGRDSKVLLSQALAMKFPYLSKSRQLRKIVSRFLGVGPKQEEPLFKKGLQAERNPWFETENEAYAGRRLTESLLRAVGSAGLTPLLRHADRNSMAWSVESRVPFLTLSLAERVLSLPEHYLVSATGETKSVFRAAMKGIVPESVINRRDKIGFETPELTWLQSLGSEREALLVGLEESQILSSQAVRERVDLIVRGERRFESSTWRIINYLAWCREFNLPT